jgi:hypothetical protein
MSESQQEIVSQLRDMARRGDSVGAMFRVLKKRLGPDGTILAIIECMRSAFCLSLSEVKPVAALSRTEQREVADENLLNELVMPEIDKHRSEWDA